VSKILIINHYAGSPIHGMEYRPYYLAREWVKTGHDVRIVAAGFSHVRSKQPTAEGKPIKFRSVECIDGIEYAWYPSPPYQGNGVGRVLNIWAFLRQVWTDARRLVAESRPDVVIASSTYPLDIWIAKRLARLANAKLVYEVHDLWPLSPIELTGMSPRHPFIQLCQWAENTAYRDADYVISMLPKVHEHMAKHGLDLRKLHIIPNGISPDDWQGEKQAITGELDEYMKSSHAHGNVIVGYAGSHGLPNALDTLLDAAKFLIDKPIRFVLVGDGHEKVRLQRRVIDEKMTHVRMFNPIPKGRIPALLSTFDVAYLGAPKLPIYRFGASPNKLLDYMMAGVPVIYAIEAGNDLVAEARCGASIGANNPKALAEAIEQFRKMDRSERLALGLNGKSFVLENLNYQALAERFLVSLGDCK
jgi:glycosyltransferase involved in cell wall biosynthesis